MSIKNYYHLPLKSAEMRSSLACLLFFPGLSLIILMAKSSSSCPNIYPREAWGARDPANPPEYLGDNMQYLFVHHSSRRECDDFDTCAAAVRDIQDLHMDGNGWDDIGYNFLIGGDGSIWEGRGWNVVGAHTLSFNYVGYGICFMGDFMDHNPTQAAQESYDFLQQCAVNTSKVITDYEMKGHRQAKPTECPGDYFYQTIQSWPHWSEGYIGPTTSSAPETSTSVPF